MPHAGSGRRRHFRDLRDNGGVLTALGIVGWSHLELSDQASAEATFRRALPLAAAIGWKRGIAMFSAGLGAALVARHDEERAAQLLGAAASIFEELGADFDGERERQTYERAVTHAQAALGKEEFAAAWERGGAMTPEELVAFAEAAA